MTATSQAANPRGTPSRTTKRTGLAAVRRCGQPNLVQVYARLRSALLSSQRAVSAYKTITFSVSAVNVHNGY
jgi:hypothetical protein